MSFDITTLPIIYAFIDPISGLILASTVVSGIGSLKKRNAEREQATIEQQRNEVREQAERRAQELRVEASVEQADISRRQEALRRRQSQLNFTRARRDLVRNRQVAQATLVNRAAGQGGIGSGLQGQLGAVSAGTARNQLALQQNFALGEQEFALNEELVNSQERFNVATGELSREAAEITSGLNRRSAGAQEDAAFGNTLTQIGNFGIQNASRINRVGSTLFSSS